MKNLFYLLVLVIIGFASCKDIQTEECEDGGKTSAQNVTFKIEPCTAEPCVLIKGKTYTISINFIPTNDIKTLKVNVRAKVYGVWVPYSIDKPDACKDCGLTCPIKAGTASLYEYSISIPTIYPAIDLVLEWKLTDDTGATPICREFPLSVKSSAQVYQAVP